MSLKGSSNHLKIWVLKRALEPLTSITPSGKFTENVKRHTFFQRNFMIWAQKALRYFFDIFQLTVTLDTTYFCKKFLDFEKYETFHFSNVILSFWRLRRFSWLYADNFYFFGLGKTRHFWCNFISSAQKTFCNFIHFWLLCWLRHLTSNVVARQKCFEKNSSFWKIQNCTSSQQFLKRVSVDYDTWH